MEDPEIPKVASEHLGPQPLPGNQSLRLCRGELHAEESTAWRPLDGDLESSDFMRSSEFRQFVWNCLLFAQESEPLCGFDPRF